MTRRGATFAEIAIATLFLALAMVPLLDSILSGSRRTREDRNRVFATVLASNVLERYRLERPAGAASAAADAAFDPALSPENPPEGWAEMRDKFQVETTATPGGDTAVLRVVVTWDEAGQTRRVEAATLLAETFPGGSGL